METTERHWNRPPKSLRLAESSLHVWRANLVKAGDFPDELFTAEELARARRFVFERDRERWRRARGILRTLLGRMLDLDPSTLQLSLGPRGKPALSNAADAGPQFNLSHSGDLALYAFARYPVGIDVEVARPGINAIALAERALGHDQADRLRLLPASRREREFLRLWVRHEAALKCRGSGLGAAADERDLWLSELDVGSDATAAVAADGTPEELRLWDWPAV